MAARSSSSSSPDTTQDTPQGKEENEVIPQGDEVIPGIPKAKTNAKASPRRPPLEDKTRLLKTKTMVIFASKELPPNHDRLSPHWFVYCVSTYSSMYAPEELSHFLFDPHHSPPTWGVAAQQQQQPIYNTPHPKAKNLPGEEESQGITNTRIPKTHPQGQDESKGTTEAVGFDKCFKTESVISMVQAETDVSSHPWCVWDSGQRIFHLTVPVLLSPQ